MKDSSLAIQTFVDQMFGENALVVAAGDAGGERVGWVVDPSFSPQVDELLGYVAEQGIRVEAIVLTHGHADHIVGLDAVHEAHPQAKILMAAEDQPMLGDARKNLSAGFGMAVTVEARATGDLPPEAELTLGQSIWRILDTSGHSPGGRSLYSPTGGVAIVGDALFAGSIGRTDFPGSDHDRLIRNIREKLFMLPADTVVYSGHGPPTTIGKERKSNPFLAE